MTADNSDDDGDEEAEPEPETAESEEFYESLDRLLSSSCSSTSASDDDSAAPAEHPRGRRGRGAGLLALASSFDVWTTEPTSVIDRRRRLLQQFGLADDPGLARLKSIPRTAGRDGGSPPSNDDLSYGPSPATVGSNDVNNSPVRFRYQHQHPPSNGSSPASGETTSGARSRPSSTNNLQAYDGDATGGGGGSAVGVPGGDGEGFSDDPRHLIKNLDTGREFVVKEFREDGTWKKLREVGTGRQVTMEEFELCVGRSPIVQELMRRQSAKESANTSGGSSSGGLSSTKARTGMASGGGTTSQKRRSWFSSIKSVVGTVVDRVQHQERRSSDDRDTSSEKGGRRSSSTTDDSQEVSRGLRHWPERIKVRHHWKSHKEFTGLFMIQEIQAHAGAIWSIKFSSDGRYLASAGEDRVIHVWEVSEMDTKADLLKERASEENEISSPIAVAISDGLPEPAWALARAEGNHWEKKQRAKVPGARKSMSSEHLVVPEQVFSLSDKPVCSFRGHLDDVLDLSWSRSQYLLSSSMDKTVRLWHMSSNSCLKAFSHSDYVTCIQFNPVDDRYFISGSLDEKVRIWSIPDRQIVDWNDLHDMVTATCYNPDGKGALVGSHNGSCHLYDTSDNKLLQRSLIDVENRKKKSKHKKITGFQFAPGSSSKVLITSADSRIRVIDGGELVHRFKGFRNTSSQISAYFTSDGKYVICASEDSNVYIWKYIDDSKPGRSTGVADTHSYENFQCQDVTVAIPWQRSDTREIVITPSDQQNELDEESQANSPSMAETKVDQVLPSPYNWHNDLQPHNSILNPSPNRFSDRVSATWPEELMTTDKQGYQTNKEAAQNRSAWGSVIVTAGRGGEIRVFQNFGLPI